VAGRRPGNNGHAYAAIAAVCALVITVALGRRELDAPPSRTPEDAVPSVGTLAGADTAGREAQPMTDAELLLAAYLLEGRLTDAKALMAREVDRFHASSEAERVATLLLLKLRLSRWLKRPPPSLDDLAWLGAALNGRPEYNELSVALYAEIALAPAGSPSVDPNAAATTLAGIEMNAAKTASGDRLLLDSMLVMTVPLVRAVRGDEEARKRFRETDRARFSRRAAAALDAGLAMEAVGDLAGAEEAYTLASDPLHTKIDPLSGVVARIKRAALYRSQKRIAEANELAANIDKLWVKADPDIRAALERLR
jgi:hypothetical protein